MEDNKQSQQQPITFHERYELKRLLGRGNFSEVWLVDDIRTHTEVALKIYAPGTGLDDTGLDVFAREFAIVINANHENILRPMHYDVCDRRPYLVLPFCANGSTQRRVGMMNEAQAWKLLHDVATALLFLHTMKPPIIHQDIKPDNVLISDSGDYMLTDFGVSSHCRSVLRKSVSNNFKSAGTTAYMAPERFGRESGTPIMASDIYSLAATTFELLTGDVPFGNDGGLRQKKGAEIPDLPETFSPELRKLVNLCLSLEPWARPSASEVADYAARGMKGERVFKENRKNILRRFWPWMLAGALVVGGGVCAVVYFADDSAEEQEQGEPLPSEDVDDTSDHFSETKTPETTPAPQKTLPSQQSPQPVAPTANNGAYAAARKKLLAKKTAVAGLRELENLSRQQGASQRDEALYLLSRLHYKSRGTTSLAADVRTMQKNLGGNISMSYTKAHQFLLDAVKVNPSNYKALYELGRDFRAGSVRGCKRDVAAARRYLELAESAAAKAGDNAYLGRIRQEKAKTH